MVSLPSKWAKKFKLKKGDEVEVSESGDVLCLSSDKETISGESILDVSDVKSQRHIAHHFVPAYYRAGIDAINLRFNQPLDLARLKEFLLKGTVGFEIIRQGEKSLFVKSVTKGIDDEFDSVLRRTFLLIKSLQAESLDLIKKKDFEGLKNVMHYDDTVNRLTNICQRSLSKGYTGYEKKTFIHYIVCELEKISDEYNWMFSYFKAGRNVALGKEFLGIYNRANELFSSYYEVFYKPDLNKIANLYDEVDDLVKRSTKLIKNSKSKEEIIALHYLVTITRRVYSMLSPTISLNAKINPSQQ